MQLAASSWVGSTGVQIEGVLLVLLLALLLGLMVARKVVGRLPVFATLLGFSIVRSTMLVCLSGRLGRPGLSLLHDGLSVLDMALQLGVLAEIASAWVSEHGGWTRLRVGALVALLVWSTAGAWLAGALWGAAGQTAMDRSQCALSLCFVLLFGWASQVPMAAAAWRAIEGLAVYNLASLVVQVERYRAAAAHDAASWAGWSYGLAGVYLAVVVFLLATLGRRGDPGQVLSMRSWRSAERLVSRRA
jgi:hypothetical protein